MKRVPGGCPPSFVGLAPPPAARGLPVVRLPPASGAAAAVVCDAMVELMDLGATFVELAGGRAVRHSRARSLVPVLETPSRSHRDVSLSELRRELMIATPDWKVALNRSGEVYLLYDLQANPLETRNLAAIEQFAGIERDLRRHLQQVVDAAR